VTGWGFDGVFQSLGRFWGDSSIAEYLAQMDLELVSIAGVFGKVKVYHLAVKNVTTLDK
jgi:hypothetical protein